MHSRSAAPPLRSGLTVATLFLLAAIAVSGVLPLWLDEIIQLRETRNTTPAQLIASLPRQPGAAPLGYLIQQAVLQGAGYSVRGARFPSALFMAGTVLVVAILGAELGVASPWIGAALFGVFPVTLRYACESRIYAQALFFSTLATLLFVRLVKSPGRLRTSAYCLALVAAIYTQPFAAFAGLAHFAWAVSTRDRKADVLSIFGVVLAILSFLPWFFWSRAIWSAGIAGAGVHFTFSLKTPLMLFRELAGAGYWGSGLLLILAALAVAKRGQDSEQPLAGVAAPAVGARGQDSEQPPAAVAAPAIATRGQDSEQPPAAVDAPPIGTRGQDSEQPPAAMAAPAVGTRRQHGEQPPAAVAAPAIATRGQDSEQPPAAADAPPIGARGQDSEQPPAAVAALKRGQHGEQPRAAVFLSLLIGIPIVLALAADSLFGYFVATRQIIWVVPAVAVLAAIGVGNKPRIAVPVALLLTAFCIWQNVRFFTAPRENWQAAADILLSEVKQGACLVVVPPEQQYSYEFFRPELARSRCPSSRTVVAFTPYATPSQREAAVSALRSEGYVRQHAADAGKSEVVLFSR